LVDRLKDELSEIKEPDTGERLFTNIFRSDELYSGPVAGYAPDVILDAYGSQWNIRTRQPAPHKGRQHSRYFITFDQNRDYGWHSPDGVFVFSGRAVQPSQTAHAGHVMDVPATLLHIYDVPVPEDWDGRVMFDLLAPELSRRPLRMQPGDAGLKPLAENAYSSEEADLVVNHLRALGYLD
jgi:predicted AlkP superfamily phosphohydrolase/phosphomutase